jgi:hypothetical protein
MLLDNQFPFQDDTKSDDSHDATQYQALSDNYKQANYLLATGSKEEINSFAQWPGFNSL